MKILVVDDEQQMRPLFEQRFRREIREGTVELTFAYSGEEALTMLPDLGLVLILSDINMPGISGLELLRRIRIMHPDRTSPPAVVMITAYGDAGNRQEAQAHGANDFLTKPIDFALLKDKLKQLGDQ